MENNTDFTNNAEYPDRKKTKLRMMNIDTALRFKQICMELQIADDDIEAKERILDELAKHYKMTVWETNRSVTDVLNDMGKHYGNILYLKKEQENE